MTDHSFTLIDTFPERRNPFKRFWYSVLCWWGHKPGLKPVRFELILSEDQMTFCDAVAVYECERCRRETK